MSTGVVHVYNCQRHESVFKSNLSISLTTIIHECLNVVWCHIHRHVTYQGYFLHKILLSKTVLLFIAFQRPLLAL